MSVCIVKIYNFVCILHTNKHLSEIIHKYVLQKPNLIFSVGAYVCLYCLRENNWLENICVCVLFSMNDYTSKLHENGYESVKQKILKTFFIVFYSFFCCFLLLLLFCIVMITSNSSCCSSCCRVLLLLRIYHSIKLNYFWQVLMRHHFNCLHTCFTTIWGSVYSWWLVCVCVSANVYMYVCMWMFIMLN